MQNPLRDVRIFLLTWKGKGKRYDREIKIITAYSRSGLTVHAWDGYSDNVIGRARGGGYDKTHTALGSAIAHVMESYWLPRPQLAHLGSSGFKAVADAVDALGWKVESIA